MNRRLTDKLDLLEARLGALIEGGARRLFPGGESAGGLARQLVEAMRLGIQVGPGGEALAPNLYTLLVNPEQVGAYQADQGLLDELGRTLLESGMEAGLHFPSPPVVKVAADPLVAGGEVRLLAQNSLEDLSQTSDVTAAPDPGAGMPLTNAFLIVDGRGVFPLEGRLVNIGRREDNQLVIDNRRVSRLHAQVRLVDGRFVIFDLDSAGGTWVNGQRVRQQALYPGDVISIAGVPLVYGQETQDLGETQEYIPPPPGA